MCRCCLSHFVRAIPCPLYVFFFFHLIIFMCTFLHTYCNKSVCAEWTWCAKPHTFMHHFTISSWPYNALRMQLMAHLNTNTHINTSHSPLIHSYSLFCFAFIWIQIGFWSFSYVHICLICFDSFYWCHWLKFRTQFGISFHFIR